MFDAHTVQITKKTTQPTVYPVNDVPRKDPLERLGVSEGSVEATFTWKDPSEASKTPGVFPRGLSMGHH